MSFRKLVAFLPFIAAAALPSLAHAHYATFVDMETGGNFTESNAKTPALAAAGAKAGCVKLATKLGASKKGAECTLLTSGSETGMLAISSSDGSIGFGFSDDLEVARAKSMKSCEMANQGKSACEPASHWQETFGDGRKARAQSSPTTSRNVVRCRNTCTNGSCLRTFEDGRTERWQAPRKFDPFTGNWGWDTSTNACGI